MEVRAEQPGDIAGIRSLTVAAFTASDHGYQNEATIIDTLRDASALTVSLVAVEDGELSGHAAFSPVTISGRGCGWYGLGPVAVRPDRQNNGIGQALIQEGLRRLQCSGAKGCVVLGDPGFYDRFGFRTHPAMKFEGAPPVYFQQLAFGTTVPQGTVIYHPAFYSQAHSRI